MSLPEVLLWCELKGKSTGLKFRKQHRVAGLIVDFYCAAAKLAVEIDGIVHEMGDQPEIDARRDALLRQHGIDTLRIPASEALASPVDIAEAIAAVCRERSA
jgi:very-short-patch-repair endonuclease